MLKENINSLPLPELIDLLSTNTMELLNAMLKKGSDGIIISDKRKDVLLIQSVISNKKSVNSLVSQKDVFLIPLVLN